MSKISNFESKILENYIVKAGESLLSFYNSGLEVLSNEKRDIKLKADQETEKAIKAFLKENFSFPVLGEEFNEEDNFDELTGFVVDPIDGTMNFSRGLPIFCISIGFLEKGVPTYGLIYNPVLKELIVGGKEVPLKFNGKKPTLDLNIEISQGILGTGIPTHMNIEDNSKFMEYLGNIKKFKKVRMIGSAAQSIAWIAIGRLDAYLENTIMLWDVCAGLALVEAAEGVYIMDPDPSKKYAYNVRAAINSKILNELI